ncbi:MAG: hypothetical protein J6O51_02000 [Bacteroidales bacterium]|nr:hypothetical protein [Bacteroidales bacterium]
MMSTNRILVFLTLAAVLCGCRKHTEVFFDTPFVRIEDFNGASTMDIDHKLDNLLSEIQIVVSASGNYFTAPIVVDYDIIPGDGLKEGVDYKLQQSSARSLTFSPGTYRLPIRVIWYNTGKPDASKNNTLTFRITGTSVPEMLLGLPGPDAKKKEFVFTKK